MNQGWIKNKFSKIPVPTLKESVILAAMVAVYMFSAAFVLNGDGSYGYAMILKLKDPANFAANDLAVNGSLQGNFLFYTLLFYLPFFSSNFVVLDFVISSVVSVLLLWAWYAVFSSVIKDKKLVLISMFFLLFVDERLSLGETTVPLFYLTSISSVHFLQIFAF